MANYQFEMDKHIVLFGTQGNQYIFLPSGKVIDTQEEVIAKYGEELIQINQL